MRLEDKISLVTFSSEARILLEPTNITDKARIFTIIRSMRVEGLTDENAGISMAYDDVLEHYLESGNNQVIVMTDGAFNSRSKHQETLDLARDNNTKVSLSIMAFYPPDYITPYLKEIVLEGKGHFLEIQAGDNPVLYLLEEIKYNAKQ